MKAKRLVLLSLCGVVVIVFVAIIIFHKQPRGQRSIILTTPYSTSIPPSSIEAKQYIAQAAKLASNGDYPGAEKVLRNALTMFPSDVNLKLTLEYYENQDRQHPQ